jgi:enoyl-[acyl-carrier protein] reductase II
MENRLTKMLGVRYPLILGPMRKITLGPMAAAVSENGGFGQIAASTLPAAKLREEIRKARALTDKPFGVNIPLHAPNAAEALEIVVEMGIRIITTSGGNPVKILDRTKAAGITVLHKVSTTAMGLKAQEAGVDGVIAMGFEAGGHGGRSQLTTLCLVPQLSDALDIPVVAAGGISDFRGFLAALALGAEGVEIGTRFLASPECPVALFYKEALLEAADTGTLLVGGEVMPLRVLKNQAAETFCQQGRDLKAHLKVFDYGDGEGNRENTLMPAGQGAGLIECLKPIKDIIDDFVDRAGKRSTDLAQTFKENFQ